MPNLIEARKLPQLSDGVGLLAGCLCSHAFTPGHLCQGRLSSGPTRGVIVAGVLARRKRLFPTNAANFTHSPTLLSGRQCPSGASQLGPAGARRGLPKWVWTSSTSCGLGSPLKNQRRLAITELTRKTSFDPQDRVDRNLRRAPLVVSTLSFRRLRRCFPRPAAKARAVAPYGRTSGFSFFPDATASAALFLSLFIVSGVYETPCPAIS